MPPVIFQAAVLLSKIGFAVAGAVGATGLTAALGTYGGLMVGAAVVVGGALVAKKAMSLFEIDMPTVDTDTSRQRTVKSTTEPQKIIYGEALVSGPISFVALSGTDNEDFYQTVVLAGHKLNNITDIHMDDLVIPNADINSGNAAGGQVGGSGPFGFKNSSAICTINKHQGDASQTADSLLTPLPDYTTSHRGDGIAYLAMKWTLNEHSAKTWEKYSPQNVKALVQGKSIYDPRLDVAAGNAAGANPTNASYIAYSTNPALCVADYLMDATLGMGISAAKIDWAAIITAANGCDVEVDVPGVVGAKEKRFTCNGVIFATDKHQKNINKILSSMNGNLVYSNGKYILHAGIYEAPTESLNEDDLIGAISIKTSLERSDRFNTIKGLFVDPSQNHKSSEFPKVQLADAVTRDNGEVLEKEVQYPMTNSSYGAQRLSNKLIQLSDQQKVITFPANLSALRIAAGDRVQVTVEELSWSNKVFQCVDWTFSEQGGVNLTLREDSSTSYADPAISAYSTITASGSITDAFRGVPSPSGLSVTAGLKNNELNWVNPARPADYGTIYVYASPNGNFSSAVKIGETDGTQFIHDGSNSADAVSAGDVRYYWVRAIKNIGTDAADQSNLEPNADPNTTVFSTVGRVNWSDVSGTTGAPVDNATAGAQISVNLFDSDGSTVMNQADVKNSILAQEILEVEVEAGEVLNLETGADVDIQNLGDVAIYVSNQDAVLQGNINTVSLGLSNLENTIVDLTSGVSDIYIQTTAPVPGQGGIPNPIPDFSRWYDSDDDNHPYYWTGSAWVSLEDPRIASNASDITNLTSSLATTNTNVGANSTSITALDTLTVSQGTSITSLSGSVTALESTVNNATTGVSANATGLSSLTTRVTNTEAATTVNSSNITTLTADLDQAEVDIGTKASSTALDALDVRVTSAEGTITTQSTDITALESTVDDGTTGVAANASGLTALTTRVTTAEGSISTNSSAVTTLDATYTEDLHFRTKAEDENDDLIDLETSGTLDLQELTDFVSGSSSAVQALTVRTTASEDSLVTQASDITALESTVNDPANGVNATATGLSNLTTSVSVIDGTVSTISSDLTSLTTTVGGNTTSISTQSTSIDGVEANYGVKIDNNNRITGFGLLSTTAGSTPFSEFAVVADQFSIVDPSSTEANPIQPFTVTSQKVYFGTDVVVSGDLVSTGTISADRLQIDGVMFDTETVDGVTSLVIKASGVDTSQIAENAITTARLSNDAVTVDKFANTLESTNYVADTSGWQILTSGNVEFQNAKVSGEINATSGTLSSSISIGTGDNIFKADSNGIYLGNATFANAPFKVTPGGAITATGVNITGTVDASTALTFDGANVTGTLAAGNLDVSGIITSGSLVTDSATIANDIRIGSGEAVFSADSAGIYLGNETFADAEFRVTPAGALTASSATLTGNVTASSFTLATGATLTDSDGAISNAQQLMSEVTGVVDAAQHNIPSFWRITTDDNEAPSNAEFNTAAGRFAKVNDLVITTDTTVTDPVTPNRTYGWTCTTAGATSTEAVWSAITNFMSGDLLVDGSVSADQINASSVASAVITAGSLVVENDLTDTTTIISGGNILTGTILADYIDVSGVITAGALITDSATIANDIRIGSGESVFSADSAGIYLGNTTFDDAEFRVTPAGAVTATSVNIAGTVDASTAFTFDGANVTGTMAAGNLDVAGIVTAGSLVTDSATIANDIRIGSGEAVFSADSSGIYLGNETFADAEFRVSPAGALTASSATLTGNVTASTFTLSSGATLSDADGVIANSDQVMSDVTGVVSADQHQIPSFWRVTTDDSAAPANSEFNTVAGRLAKVNDLVISTDTTTDPDRTYAWICTVAGTSSTEATWSAISNFISGDLLVDGSVKAEAIAANAVTADKVNVTDLAAISADMGTITAGSISSALITGDVTEVYPFSQYYRNDLTSTNAVYGSFSIPAPTNGISKRNKLNINVKFEIQGNNQTPAAQAQILVTIQKKSKGGASTEVSSTGNKVVVESHSVLYQQLISLTGNQLEKFDVVGAVAASDDASGTYEPVSILAAYFDSSANKTYVQVSSFNDIFTTGDDLFYSEDRFTNSGTWITPSITDPFYVITPPGSLGYSTVNIPFLQSYGLTTTASEFRIQARMSSAQSGVTYRIDGASGTLENIS